MYICVTEVDAATRIVCTESPQRTGPSMPKVKGLRILWDDSSTWPVELSPEGVYLRAPKYYGTCDDDADTNIPGVLQVLTEEEYKSLKLTELEARRPYPSWIGYEDTMTWGAPVPRPANAILNGGNVRYEWNEEIVNWVPAENQ